VQLYPFKDESFLNISLFENFALVSYENDCDPSFASIIASPQLQASFTNITELKAFCIAPWQLSAFQSYLAYSIYNKILYRDWLSARLLITQS